MSASLKSAKLDRRDDGILFFYRWLLFRLSGGSSSSFPWLSIDKEESCGFHIDRPTCSLFYSILLCSLMVLIGIAPFPHRIDGCAGTLHQGINRIKSSGTALTRTDGDIAHDAGHETQQSFLKKCFFFHMNCRNFFSHTCEPDFQGVRRER